MQGTAFHDLRSGNGVFLRGQLNIRILSFALTAMHLLLASLGETVLTFKIKQEYTWFADYCGIHLLADT